MQHRKPLATVIFLVALVAAACGGDSATSSQPTFAPIETKQGTPAAASRSASAVSTPAAASPTSTSASASPTATSAPAQASATASTAPAPTSPPAATAPPPTATAPPAPTASSVTVTADNLAFDRSVIRVKAGTRLTANFVNKETGVDHNLTFSLPGLDHETCTGPCTTTQTFTPARPGTFFFFCNLHGSMLGDFIVE